MVGTFPLRGRTRRRAAAGSLIAKLHAACWFGQPRYFARALGRSRGKQVVNLPQREAGLSAELAYHGRNLELLEVSADIVDDLPMGRSQLCNPVGAGQGQGQLVVPKLRLLNESVFVHFHLVVIPGKNSKNPLR